MDATQFGHGVEESGFELSYLVRGDGLRATEAGYPTGQ
jgi:hypothetical protein